MLVLKTLVTFALFRSNYAFIQTKRSLSNAYRSAILKSVSNSESAALSRPRWASGGVVSDVVNWLISIKPLFSMMKLGARRTLIGTAEKNGIPWTDRAKFLEASQAQLDQYYSSILSNSDSIDLEYPSYYTQEFHAYDDGNLNWQAAFECESATLSMALRVWPNEVLSAKEAQDRLRYSFLSALKQYMSSGNGSNQPKSILDVGCSVGVSTFYIAEEFPAADVTGLDLSPHFLAIAMMRQKELSQQTDSALSRIKWVHGKAESSPFSSESFDLTAACFMFHELPQLASKDIIAEIKRITKAGGCIAITDNNPRSSVIQNLPPALFTLMKSTEPWSDEYYAFDLERALMDAGFEDVQTVASDPRHRTVLARKAK